MSIREILFIVFAVIGIGSSIALSEKSKNLKNEADCKKINPEAKFYTTEKFFAETKDGCIIKKVDSFDKTCRFLDYVYVTNCSGVAWDVKTSSKPYRIIRKNNVTK